MDCSGGQTPDDDVAHCSDVGSLRSSLNTPPPLSDLPYDSVSVGDLNHDDLPDDAAPVVICEAVRIQPARRRISSLQPMEGEESFAVMQEQDAVLVKMRTDDQQQDCETDSNWLEILVDYQQFFDYSEPMDKMVSEIHSEEESHGISDVIADAWAMSDLAFSLNEERLSDVANTDEPQNMDETPDPMWSAGVARSLSPSDKFVVLSEANSAVHSGSESGQLLSPTDAVLSADYLRTPSWEIQPQDFEAIISNPQVQKDLVEMACARPTVESQTLPLPLSHAPLRFPTVSIVPNDTVETSMGASHPNYSAQRPDNLQLPLSAVMSPGISIIRDAANGSFRSCEDSTGASTVISARREDCSSSTSSGSLADQSRRPLPGCWEQLLKVVKAEKEECASWPADLYRQHDHRLHNEESAAANKVVPAPLPFVPGAEQEDADGSLNGAARGSGSPAVFNKCRDDELLQNSGVPLTAAEICEMSQDEHQTLLQDKRLTDEQAKVIREVRRRGKNKLAAQHSRKRRDEAISELRTSNAELETKRDSLSALHRELQQRVTVSTSELQSQLNAIVPEPAADVSEIENPPIAEMNPSEKESLQAEVKLMSEHIRKLKAEKADPCLLKEEVEKYVALKAKLGESDELKKFSLKTAKEMSIRQKVISLVIECFERHGAETLDTPVFELKDILTGKYGEEGGKLIYDLQDQGGELLSLRYDLTVPFARYLAMNKISNIKRYHIGKVYRRDQPTITRGRYREFYQCDFDIAGDYDSMYPEAECLAILCEIFSELNLGDFEIKINHRRLLDAMFAACGVPKDKFKSICSAIDKLDKQSWSDVRNEMINEKHLDVAVADKIHDYVMLRATKPELDFAGLVDFLLADEDLTKQKGSKESLQELRLLLQYASDFGIRDKITFEVSLARGLDYYTGVIFEAVMKDSSALLSNNDAEPTANGPSLTSTANSESQQVGVGSVAAGGRYDGLVGVFEPKHSTPCCGISIGIERVFTLYEGKLAMEQARVRTTKTEVFVASAQKKMGSERRKLARELWQAKIKTEMSYKENPKMLDQMQYCEAKGIPLAIIIGEDELRKGVVKLRTVSQRTEEEIPKVEMVKKIHDALAALT